jgi:hypothetical protein
MLNERRPRDSYPKGIKLVCRIPLDQTELNALFLGRMIVEGLEGINLLGVKSLLISDASRDAAVHWLNYANKWRMTGDQLTAIGEGERKVPLLLDNSLRFGDVFAVEE